MKDNLKKRLRMKKTAIQVAKLFDIPTDVMSNLPTIQLFGDRKIIFEGVKSVAEYGTERIAMASGKLKISVSGKELDIRYIDDKSAVIEGKINAVELERRRKNDTD